MSARRGVPSRFDLVLALAFVFVGLAELKTTYAFERDGPGPLAAHYMTIAAAAGSLAWRRILPLLVAPFVQVVLAVQVSVVAFPNTYTPIFILVIAVFSLVVYAPGPLSVVAPAVVVLGGGVVMGLFDPQDPIGSAVTAPLISILVMVAGAVVRRARARAARMTEERDAADRRTREVARQERARIARELHDVVAHGMSVVVLQAQGGRHVLDGDPVAAKDAFEVIELVASDCLREMRRLLGILRAESEEAAPLAPQPKLGELTQLVDQARSSGASVDFVIEGDTSSLAPAIELAAYRIAQEGLTNCLKHAPGSHARMSVRCGSDALVVEIVDDGPGGAVGGAGHGIIGMRERVELYGGVFAAGSEPDGGFAVRARMPFSRIST